MVCATALMPGCVTLRVSASDTRDAAEMAIRQADIAWAKAGSENDFEAVMSYYSEDASLLAPNTPIATGKEAIRKFWRQQNDSPGFAVKWHPFQVEAARLGDFGYVLGAYELTINDAEGKPSTDHGKYIAVWEKQSDGSWKCVAEMFNSDLPLPSVDK